MSENKKIQTSVMPGFMELLPADQILFDDIKSKIEKVYQEFGFIPVDTPVIERSEVLLAKAGGETEKQIYRFTKGENDLSLRFDLTVPLARYIAEHHRELVFPFRRYHIGKVYRGESPQKGRFREFYQCDVDIIGKGKLSLVNDAEIISIIYTVFSGLNFGDFTIRINNRKLLTGLLESLGVDNLSKEILREIDKIEKIEKDELQKNLMEVGVPESTVPKILQFAEIKGGTSDVLQSLNLLGIKNAIFEEGLEELKEVVEYVKQLQVPDKFVSVDLSIARGLDYYTGTVYETILNDHSDFGSVCGGGRYDNLTGNYMDEKFPGVGVAIGLTRLFSQLKNAGLIKGEVSTRTKVLIVPLVKDFSIPLQIDDMLRGKGIPVEVYFEETKMKDKLSYANKLGIPYVVIVGEDEISKELYTLKNMKTGDEVSLPIDQIVENIK